MEVTIIHNRILDGADPDETDVLQQVELVRESLSRLNHRINVIAIGDNLTGIIGKLKKSRNPVVFNLVESVFGKNELLHVVPSMLEAFGIPHTGAPAEALFLTTNKVLAKKIMKQAGIQTPEWFLPGKSGIPDKKKKYIIKPLKEDGSVGLDEEAVIRPGEDPRVPVEALMDPGRFFIEEFIGGREFNISLLSGANGPEVLPVAEIVFRDFPPGKEKILGYRSKWQQDTFEYINTVRQFNTLENSPELSGKMRRIALECWEVFNLKGYARVDFRTGRDEEPYVLEINANPCISPDSGFIAAAVEAGLSYEEVTGRILIDIN